MSIDFTDPNRAEEILREAKHAPEESKAQYELMVSMISDIVWRYEVNTIGEHVGSYISPVADKMLGLPDGTIGNSFDKYFSYVHPDDLPTVQVILSEGIRTREKDKTAEYRLRKGDGTTLWVRSKGSAYCKDGRITAFGTTSDITERKRMEDALRESERKFRETVTYLDEGYYSATLDGLLLDHNLAFNRILGIDIAKDMKGTNIPDFWQSPDDRNEYLNELMSRGFIRNYQVDAKTISGEKKVVQINAHLVKDKKGRALRIDGTFTDFTERKPAEDSLRKEKEFASGLINTTQAIILVLDPQGRIVMINPYMEAISGYWQEEVQGKDWFETFLPESDRQRIRELFSQAISGTRTKGNINPIVAKDGREIIVEWYDRTLLDPQGKATGLLSIGQDITERISAEEELRSLKTQIEFILGATKTGLDIIDAEFNIRYIDPEWQKVYGDPTGRKCYDYFMGRDKPCPGCGIVKALHTKSPTVTEEVLVKENSRPIQVTTIPFQNKAGEWLVAEVNVDITERKKAEDELIDGRNKLKALFELLPVGVSILDQNGKVIDVNPALERILDLTAEELREGKFRKRKYLRPDGSECPPEEFPSSRAVAEEGAAQNAEVGVIKEDGTKIWTDVRAISLPFPDWRVVLIVSDITGRKQAEEKLTQYSERLEEIIEARTKQLQQADRLAAIGETATMISHDLRNPLQVIVSMVYLAKEMLTSADTSSLEGRRSIVEILDDIEKSCSYMSRILSDLQCYGGPLNLKFAETDFHMLISDALSVLLIPKYVEVSIEVENGLSEITIDPEKIKRVIVNLVNNSIQSMPKGGQITITAIRKGESIVLTVRDEGMGIPNEDIPKLFFPIVTTKAKGTGLGLAICKCLVEAHGGNIVVTSKVNVGTEITIEIPQDRKTWTRS